MCGNTLYYSDCRLCGTLFRSLVGCTRAAQHKTDTYTLHIGGMHQGPLPSGQHKTDTCSCTLVFRSCLDRCAAIIMSGSKSFLQPDCHTLTRTCTHIHTHTHTHTQVYTGIQIKRKGDSSTYYVTGVCVCACMCVCVCACVCACVCGWVMATLRGWHALRRHALHHTCIMASDTSSPMLGTGGRTLEPLEPHPTHRHVHMFT